MTKPDAKKRGPKPKPKVEVRSTIKPGGEVDGPELVVVEAAQDAAPKALAEFDELVSEPEAHEDHDEPAAQEPALPLIDGADPKWAMSTSIGARHVQYTAHPDTTPADVVGMLAAKTVTFPGHDEPTPIAARSVTPPKMRPVRVTFTFRERIEA